MNAKPCFVHTSVSTDERMEDAVTQVHALVLKMSAALPSIAVS